MWSMRIQAGNWLLYGMAFLGEALCLAAMEVIWIFV